MDTTRADAAARSDAGIEPFVVIDDIEVVPFSEVVARLCCDYPGVSVTRIESILMREWEAFTAGRPLVVPVSLEGGVREMLDEG